jgi:hypothetical protein
VPNEQLYCQPRSTERVSRQSTLRLRLCGAVAVVLAITPNLPAQELDPVVLVVDVDNFVQYRGDSSDLTKLATITNPTVGVVRTFEHNVQYGDIVAINGKPAKGLWNNTFIIAPLRISPLPGQPIADVNSTGIVQCFFHFLGPDGTFVGTLADRGQEIGAGHIIESGTGAFFGIIGEHRQLDTTAARGASMTEDPSMRRVNGGVKTRLRFTLYPRVRPAVQVSANQPAISHADYSPVTASNPAHPGEVLILAATGLGPVKPNLDPPGSIQFSGPPYQEVNSPVSVVFNGAELPVSNKFGWPGQKNVYWVDFQVPSDAPSGVSTLQLIAAWIPGPSVTLPVSALPIGAH